MPVEQIAEILDRLVLTPAVGAALSQDGRG
jgi:hypothetical protein